MGEAGADDVSPKGRETTGTVTAPRQRGEPETPAASLITWASGAAQNVVNK
jgi:hypothetical protein